LAGDHIALTPGTALAMLDSPPTVVRGEAPPVEQVQRALPGVLEDARAMSRDPRADGTVGETIAVVFGGAGLLAVGGALRAARYPRDRGTSAVPQPQH
jgi:hypothetical protein